MPAYRLPKLLVALGVLAGTLGQATVASAAQSSATASANAGAKIITAISLVKSTDLNFGDVVPGSGGTVVLTTGGSRTSTSGVSLGNTSGASVAAFTVGGQQGEAYNITLPSSTTISNGSATMTVDTFTSNPSGSSTIPSGGQETLNVGATLNVGNNQATGSYTGTFSVTVAYQ